MRETALVVRDGAGGAGACRAYAKTTGSRGIHVYVPIVRGPTQKEVWDFAKAFAQSLEALHPDADHRRVPDRASGRAGRVLVDYNQNAWGRTLASIYSVRPTPRAAVSTPVTWAEVERGRRASRTSTCDNVPARIARRGDLWAPAGRRGRAASASRGTCDHGAPRARRAC